MSKTEKSEQNDREIAAFLTKYGDLWLRERDLNPRPPGYELRPVLSGVSAPFIPIRYLFRPIQLHCFHPLLSSLQPVWVMVWVMPLS